MRIALVAPAIPDYCFEFAGLAAEVGDTRLFAPQSMATDREMPVRPGLQIDLVPWPRQREAVRSIAFIRDLARSIRAWKPDIVHILNDTAWITLLIPLLRPIPTLMTLHDVEAHPGDVSSRRVPQFLVRFLANQSDGLMVHGPGLAADAQRLLAVPKPRIFVFPHLPLVDYADLAKQQGIGAPSGSSFGVLFFGRIYKYKGLRYLLEAAPAIKQAVPEARFVIAGSGEPFSKYAAYVPDPSWFAVENGFIPRTEAARLFAEASCVVLPYVEASQSGVLMIATSFGLPVVVTDVGEMAEIVLSSEIGLVVPPHDPSAIADAVIAIARDRALRKRFSENARALLKGPYSRDSLSRRLARIYESVRELR